MIPRTLTAALTSALLALTIGVARGEGAPASTAWGAFFTSLRPVPIKAGSTLELKAGDAVRFQGVTNTWCGDKNSGLEVLEGGGTILDADPMREGKKMNKSGQYGMVRITGLDASSFFVASNTPTKVRLLVTSFSKLGQECGE